MYSRKNGGFPIGFWRGDIEHMLAQTPFVNKICKLILTIIYVKIVLGQHCALYPYSWIWKKNRWISMFLKECGNGNMTS